MFFSPLFLMQREHFTLINKDFCVFMSHAPHFYQKPSAFCSCILTSAEIKTFYLIFLNSALCTRSNSGRGLRLPNMSEIGSKVFAYHFQEFLLINEKKKNVTKQKGMMVNNFWARINIFISSQETFCRHNDTRFIILTATATTHHSRFGVVHCIWFPANPKHTKKLIKSGSSCFCHFFSFSVRNSSIVAFFIFIIKIRMVLRFSKDVFYVCDFSHVHR